MTKKYVSAMVIIILLAVLTGSVILLCVRNPEVHFSRKDAFQEEAFDLTLSAGIRGGTIYYTLNGDTPTTESDVYTMPIRVEAGLPMATTVVKAMVVQGGIESSVYTQTYFVGRGVSELFDTMVVSLTTDQANLYDEKTGIFTNWDQINDENGSWERQAYIEFYEHDGTPMIAQGTGIAVSGHGSRGYDQKSIKLIASKQYDMEHPVFDYDFFDTDMAGNAKGQSYNRLVLRNGGSDHEGTMIKWNVVSRLGKEAGIVCAGARPGVLFVNGAYYGIIQLQEKYSRYNVASAIGARKQDITKYEPNEINSSRFGEYYGRLHSDLNDPERQEKLEESVDMTDMLQHYAVNCIMNNVDWPFHNFFSWKCAAGTNSSYADGKVRFFLYDLDAVYGDTSKGEIANEFDYLMQEPVEDMTDTLSILMKSDKYRTQFVNMVCDLTNTTFAADHVLQVIDEEDQKIAHSMALYYTDAERTRQQEAVKVMREKASESCMVIHAGLQNNLGAAEPYTLKLQVPDGLSVAFSQIRLSGETEYEGGYYHNYPLTLVVNDDDGNSYHWMINGERVDGSELLLDSSYTDNELNIQLVVDK
ncbi:MAG: CotH kinase family protein [Lachnospiraceae bacterium]|nr:CotH kinase family protein [Lachnospiraceae bacterium]